MKNAFEKFADAISEIGAHGDYRADGTEVIWPPGYAEAQLWEIIYTARLISTSDNQDISAFHTPTRRAAPHEDCIAISKKIA